MRSLQHTDPTRPTGGAVGASLRSLSSRINSGGQEGLALDGIAPDSVVLAQDDP